MVVTERNVVVLRQALAILPVCLVQCMLGIGVGWLAPMLFYLKSSPELAFTPEDCSWIAALHYASRGFTCVIAVPLIDRLGRNICFIIASCICFSMWIVVYLSLNVYVHYAVRVFFGFAIGLHDVASGIYLGETCSPTLRGIFGGFLMSSFYLGEVIEFVLAASLSYGWVAIVNCAFGFLAVLSTFFLKEPAHYLILKGKLAKAESNFDWLHDLQNPTKKREFEDIKKDVSEQKGRGFSWQLLRSVEVYKSLRIVVITNVLCYLCGYTAVNAFLTIALSQSKSISNANLTIISGTILFVAILSSSPFIDHFNRRTLALSTSLVICLVHAATAVLYIVNNIYQIPNFPWFLFTLLTGFMCLHGMIVFPLAMVIRGELLPLNVKALGSCLAGIFGSLGGFAMARIYLPISLAYGEYVNFIMFSLISLVMYLYMYYDLPETRGKTLIDIQRELKGVTNAEKHGDTDPSTGNGCGLDESIPPTE